MQHTACTNRRSFLETSVATSCLSALHVSLFPEGTLAKVAGIGYKEVEFAGLFDDSPKDVRAMLDHEGPSAHLSYAMVEAKWSETLDAAHVLGQQLIVS